MRQVLHPLFALLASVTRQDLARQIAYLKEENRILRSRLPSQVNVTAKERSRLWTLRGFVDVYFLVFLHLGTRRCWISPSTVSPDSAWSCQQARNFLMHAEDVMLPPKYVLRDNDGKYTSQYNEVFESNDAEVVRTTPMSPNLRAHVERMIQTLKFECLDKFVIVSERHLNLLNREFQWLYNVSSHYLFVRCV